LKYFHKVQIKAVPPIGNRHQHWTKTAKERQLWHSLVASAFKFTPKEPVQKCIIRVTRFAARQPDFDNLVWSFKAVFDGLVKARIIEDDNMNVVIDRKYSFCKVPQKNEQITIEVEEI
jgi:Holliday junction resolvase RusA-like endonuclease